MGKSLAEGLTEEALKTDITIKVKNSDLKEEAENEEKLMKPYDPKTHSEFLELARFQIEDATEQLERELRKENALKAYEFSRKWAMFIGILILLQGFGKHCNFFQITQTEFLFVIGTLTTGIFTFYTLVLKYLFYRKPEVISISKMRAKVPTKSKQKTTKA